MGLGRRRRERRPIDKPPAQFPTVIRPHVYNPSPWKTCLDCGQHVSFRLHITPHHYEINLNSKKKACMCGLKKEHSIHSKGN